MLVLYGMYNSIQFGSVEDKSTTIIILYNYHHFELYFGKENNSGMNCSIKLQIYCDCIKEFLEFVFLIDDDCS